MAEQEYQVRNKHMLVVAGLLGLIAVLLFLWHDYRIRQENNENRIPVVVAAIEMRPGDRLSKDNMKEDFLPQRLVPMDVLDDVARMSDWNALLNMEVIQDIAPGRIIRWSYLSAGSSPSGGPLLPRPGYRLVPVGVDRSKCPPGLEVGMYVDLKVTMADPVGGGSVTETAMEMVQVKAINGTGQAGASFRSVNSVSVEVTERDTDLLLAFLKRVGDDAIILVPRNPEDKQSMVGFNPKLIPGSSGGSLVPPR